MLFPINWADETGGYMRGTYQDHEFVDYPIAMYLNYTQSLCLAIERRVNDEPPQRPNEYWQIVEDEVKSSRWRMRMISGGIRKLGSKPADVPETIPGLIGQLDEGHALVDEKPVKPKESLNRVIRRESKAR